MYIHVHVYKLCTSKSALLNDVAGSGNVTRSLATVVDQIDISSKRE